MAGIFIGLTSGCVELHLLLGLNPPGRSDGNGSANHDGTGPDNGANTGLPIVTLRTSNATPQLDEQVTLTCTLESGSSENLTFVFSSTLPRLTVDERRGTGEFIVEEADLGTAYSFSCSATNLIGTGPRSRQVVITPTDVMLP